MIEPGLTFARSADDIYQTVGRGMAPTCWHITLGMVSQVVPERDGFTAGAQYGQGTARPTTEAGAVRRCKLIQWERRVFVVPN